MFLLVREGGDFLDRGGGADAEFFLDLARGGFGVGLAGVDVAGGAGVPLQGMRVLPAGTALEEEGRRVR